MSIIAEIDFLFNKWRKYEITEVFIDEASQISEETWKKLNKMEVKNERNN